MRCRGSGPGPPPLRAAGRPPPDLARLREASGAARLVRRRSLGRATGGGPPQGPGLGVATRLGTGWAKTLSATAFGAPARACTADLCTRRRVRAPLTVSVGRGPATEAGRGRPSRPPADRGREGRARRPARTRSLVRTERRRGAPTEKTQLLPPMRAPSQRLQETGVGPHGPTAQGVEFALSVEVRPALAPATHPGLRPPVPAPRPRGRDQPFLALQREESRLSGRASSSPASPVGARHKPQSCSS